MERRHHKQDDPVALGQYVRRRREAAGLSVRGLARAAGMDATGISRLENGENVPTPQTLARLARVLEVDVNDLYTLAGYPISQQLPSFEPYLRARYDLSAETIEKLAPIFELAIEHEQHEKGGSHDDDRDQADSHDSATA